MEIFSLEVKFLYFCSKHSYEQKCKKKKKKKIIIIIINVYPSIPHFYYIKVGLKGVNII